MKNNHSIARWASGLAAAALLILTGPVHAGVADTKHNLSSTASAATRDLVSNNSEICVFCHTPHSALVNGVIPLWNQQLSTHDNYGVYTSATFDATAAEVGDGGADPLTSATATNLCLSCHDGTVAVGSFNRASSLQDPLAWDTNNSVLDGSGLMISGALLGTTLTDDHPVNFLYSDSTAADGTALVATTVVGSRETVGTLPLFEGKVQCASCHDPHSSDFPAFTRVSMDASGLCTTCHVK